MENLQPSPSSSTDRPRPPTQIPSHHPSTPTSHPPSNPLPRKLPLPGRRNQVISRLSSSTPRRTSTTTSSSSFFFLVVLLISCINIKTASAAALLIPEQMVETSALIEAVSRHPEPEDPRSAVERLAHSEPILIDHSYSDEPTSKDWRLATVNDLRRRQVGDIPDEKKTTTSATKKETVTPAPTNSGTKATQTATGTGTGTGTATQSKTSSAVDLPEETALTPLPQAFDSGLSGSVTPGCQTFMDTMLANKTFVDCHPFSLLLKNSVSFFQASRSVTLMTRVLEASCGANFATCSNLMASFATSISLQSNCASDLTNNNQFIEQALGGLLAYKPLYTASCLRNPVTSSFCFADAITNKTSFTDSYIYFLPLGTNLTSAAQPTCSQCLKDTMGIFGADTANRGGNGKPASALVETYRPAAEQINLKCGPGFVNASLAAPISGAMGPYTPSSSTGLLALCIIVMSWIL